MTNVQTEERTAYLRQAARDFADQHDIRLSAAEWGFVDEALTTHDARMSGEGTAA